MTARELVLDVYAGEVPEAVYPLAELSVVVARSICKVQASPQRDRKAGLYNPRISAGNKLIASLHHAHTGFGPVIPQQKTLPS